MATRMLTLAFDTATEMCTVALGRGDDVLAAVDVHAPRAHLQKLFPLAEHVLALSERAQADIEAVAVGTGPGSLTGVRIGVTAARTLAQALGVPCIGLPTLDVIAHAFSSTGATVCVVADARRQEVYAAMYECSGPTPRRLTDIRAMAPGALAESLAARSEERIVLAGDGLISYGEAITEGLGERARISSPPLWYPRAAHLVTLAALQSSEDVRSFDDVRPIYTRLSDAEEAEKARK